MSVYSKIVDLQNLGEAWKKVKKNKPACGADNITYEEFDSRAREELKQLNLMLVQHEYEVSPVKIVSMKKGEKMREIALYNMTDKVVQASIAMQLNRIYDKSFSPRAFAYRNEQSALVAIDSIEKEILTNQYVYFCKMDIKGFFDHVNLNRLKQMLENRIKETDTVELIMSQLRAPAITFYGELVEKQVGLYQGSGISPILSNVYMQMFDKELEKQNVYYVRYADDILLLADSKERIEECMNLIHGLLENLDLELNPEKTCSGRLKDGVDFLGYHFDHSGKSIPVKAISKLSTNLEDVWLTMLGRTMEEKLQKSSQILNGWEQYFREDHKIQNIYEYTTLVYMTRYKDELHSLQEIRKDFTNIHKEICSFLVSVWQECHRMDLCILEYEQYFGIDVEPRKNSNEIYQKELLDTLSRLFVKCDRDDLISLMQTYSDMSLYKQAEIVETKLKQSEQEKQQILPMQPLETDNAYVYNKVSVQLMMDVFVGKEDMFSREVLDENKKRKTEYVPKPLTQDELRKHLEGTDTIDTFLVRNNDTVKYVVFDIDVCKKVMLQEKNLESFQQYVQMAGVVAKELHRLIGDMGLNTYIEFSGYRGYHVWLFFEEWIPVRYAYSIIDIIMDKYVVKQEGITIELFPQKNKKKSGRYGQCIKVPYGIHPISGNRSYMCANDLEPILDVNQALDGIAKYSMENIKKVIGSFIADVKSTDNKSNGRKSLTIDYSQMNTMDESVHEVLEGCSLMKYLVNKAMSTGYLSHFERLSVLHVFGHLGEGGKEFVHTVMSFTLNYQYHVTQRFIERMPAKPVSCIKLREQYKQITAEYGCSCAFKRTKDCYPSPVIHALRNNKNVDNSITIPVSRTMTKAKEEKVYDELNIHNKVQDLANKMVELKKQKRGIDKSVRKLENELNIAFDSVGVDCMEVDMGLLVRKKTHDIYEWYIEI